MASVVPNVVGISPHSKLLQCESGEDRVYDNPAPLQEETQIPIPLAENVCYATTLQVSERKVKTSKVDDE